MQQSDSFRAMDTDVDVIAGLAAATDAPFAQVRALFEEQEQRFSRFREGSLLSRLNRGESVSDPQFLRCCEKALEAWEFTRGLFNPMVLPALARAGYERTFAEVAGGRPSAGEAPSPAACLAFAGRGVRLRSGALDLGGIAKGWTVDLAVTLLGERCTDVLVNAGGDMRCSGGEEGLRGWLVGVEGREGGAAWEGRLEGALATSTTAKRRWTAAGGEMAHHLIDPRSGLPADSPYEQVSAMAKETWVAECWAKAALIGGEEAAGRAAKAVDGLLAIGIGAEVRRWGRFAG
ncbi:MAG: FAD:protein FMN transferase [Tepidiformaceae bacterium]